MRQEILIGVERRPRWFDEQKLAIIKKVGLDGATVADVARRHDVTRQHIYPWGAELRRTARTILHLKICQLRKRLSLHLVVGKA